MFYFSIVATMFWKCDNFLIMQTTLRHYRMASQISKTILLPNSINSSIHKMVKHLVKVSQHSLQEFCCCCVFDLAVESRRYRIKEVNLVILTLWVPTPQNDQIHSNNLSAAAGDCLCSFYYMVKSLQRFPLFPFLSSDNSYQRVPY